MNPDLPIVPALPLGWGAWVVLLIIPSFIWLFKLINRHYADAAQIVLCLVTLRAAPPPPPGCCAHRAAESSTVRAVQSGAAISPNVNAVYVANDPVAAAELEANWERWSFGIPLTVIESPYRSLTGPLMHFLAD